MKNKVNNALKHIRDVRCELEQELKGKDGILGTALSKSRNGKPVIVVYISKEHPEVRDHVPSIKGHIKVQTKEIGEISAL